MGGMSTSLTSDEMILPNAPPMITPIAISKTLPFMANSLNSFSISPPSRRKGELRIRRANVSLSNQRHIPES